MEKCSDRAGDFLREHKNKFMQTYWKIHVFVI